MIFIAEHEHCGFDDDFSANSFLSVFDCNSQGIKMDGLN